MTTSKEKSQDTESKRCLQIEMPIVVKTYDIDSAGHVSNIVYLRWMEDMRLQIFEEHFPLKSFIEQGYVPVLASTHIEYKRPIKLFDNPIGYMWISSIGSASMKFQGEIRVNSNLATLATHVGVFVDNKTSRPVKLPDLLVKKFKEAKLKL